MASSSNKTLLLISLIVCVAALCYVFSHISPRQVFDLIINADKQALLIFLSCSLTMSFFRMLRYKLLLNFSGHKPNSFALYLVVLIRNFFADILPARAGTLVYVLLANKRLGVSLDQATSSFSLSLVFDICSVAPMVLVALLFIGDTGAISSFTIAIAALVFLILSFALIYFTPSAFRILAWG